jgi:hypothetical protein
MVSSFFVKRLTICGKSKKDIDTTKGSVKSVEAWRHGRFGRRASTIVEITALIIK